MHARVALIRPPVDVLHKFSKLVENLAIGYLATALRCEGHEVLLVDAMIRNWSPDETAKHVLDFCPNLVGMTVVLQYLPAEVGKLARLLREGGYSGPILIGGHAVSFFPERILEAVADVDAVVCGEGEEAIRYIAAAVASGQAWTGAPGLCSRAGAGSRRTRSTRIRDLDGLGHPARDLTPDIIACDGLSAISTSRGCYARCSFCSVPRFYGLERGRALASGDWLARSVAGAIDDISDLHRRFAIRELLIVDDEFFGGAATSVARALSFGRALEELDIPLRFALSCRAENVEPAVFDQLKRGGLAHVFVGLESGNNSDLKLYGKGHSVEQNRDAVRIIKGLGLSFQPGFMLFNYRSTLREVRQNLEFLKDIGECKPITLNTAVDPHFGTPLVWAMEREGVLQDDLIAMKARYLDSRVATAKIVAEKCATAFQPYMNFIAGIRSSVTYEWRRAVPGRRPQEERLLDAFEQQVNDQFSRVVCDAVDQLDRFPEPAAKEVIWAAEEELEGIGERLAVARSLIVTHLQGVEGAIRYVTQSDLMRTAAATGSH
jgi:radical SAM superfamily enzyme YgiQ (UPF0313 family)